MENFKPRPRRQPSPSLHPDPPRSSSVLSTLSAKTADTETTAARKEAHRIFERESLPSVYRKVDFSLPDFVNVPVDVRAGDSNGNVVAWDGEGDKTKPVNWPAWKKGLNILCLFLMSLISPFTSSVIAPAIPTIMIHYNTHDEYLSGFVVSAYVLGYAFGPLLVSPLAELYGRVPLYHTCNVLFTICTCRCAYAGSLRDLAILRFFAGVGGSSVFALIPSSVADMMIKEKRGGVFALIALAYNLGPAISPTAGAYINDALGWKSIFHITSISGGGVTLLSLLCLRETYDVTLLRRKAERERKRTGHPHLRSRLDIDSNTSKPKEIGRAMLMPLRLLATPSIFLVSLITAVGYGWMYILYITLPTTFIEEYGWAQKKLGLAYLGVAIGNLIGMAIGFGVSDAFVKRRAAKGDMRPENRLVPMMYLWPLVGVGLVIYGWTAAKNTHWIGPMIGTGVFSVGAMSAVFFTGTYIVDAYPKHSASGMAASSVLRSLIGGLAPLFAEKLYSKFDVGWAFTLLAGIAMAFAPVPWIVYRFGEVLSRERRTTEGVDVDGRGGGGKEGVGADTESFLQTNTPRKEVV